VELGIESTVVVINVTIGSGRPVPFQRLGVIRAAATAPPIDLIEWTQRLAGW
jgi:hypothetical protein